MAISDREAQRLNYSMPVANDLKLGDIIKELQESVGGGDVTWDTLPGKPSTFPPSSHTHGIADIDGLQSALDSKIESVAWDDVSGKPSAFPPSSHTHTIEDVSGLQSALDSKLESVSWGDVQGKPSTFPPESHTHTADSVTVTSIPNATGSNVQEVLEDLAARIAALENGEGE